MVGEPRVPTSAVCSHERRVFPRAELVATTFNRGRFLSSWKKNFQFTTIPFGLVFCVFLGASYVSSERRMFPRAPLVPTS
jgi:hypothetical protein